MKIFTTKFRVPILFFIISLIVLVFAWSQVDQTGRQSLKIYRFKRSKGITIPILPKGDFAARIAMDASLPHTGTEVVNLAKRLYSPGRKEINEKCGEYPLGRLFISLSNPDITDADRNAVDETIDADMPSLPRTYTEGHFRFLYTDNDTNADHNVTLADIQATAKVLNDSWTKYSQDFTTPQKGYVSGGGCTPQVDMIDVKVYYLGQYLYGATSSYWDYIELNSKHVVKDACERQSTPAHELFHRVEYSYGYVSGAQSNMKWATEGSASWSQKYMAPGVGDWMDRMNEGLDNPDVALISGRAYDACDFWVYLGERGNGEAATIKEVWSTYNTNGKDMKGAIGTTVQNRIPNCGSFDQFSGWWMFTNYYKDLSNADPLFDYVEDELKVPCGTITYGPLVQVPTTPRDLRPGVLNTININGTVAAYGADYYVFAPDSTVKAVQIACTGDDQNFGYALIGIRNNEEINHTITAHGEKYYNINLPVLALMAIKTPTHFSFIVMGNPRGGNYTLVVSASN